ncbi:hypothetical protein DFH11DRAFT_1549026 [Phellopilus nigrolimitatus]|nr:hypothetical protein DFH11DRAFT_1549026 [Phellopilus nigrolimitatus]
MSTSSEVIRVNMAVVILTNATRSPAYTACSKWSSLSKRVTNNIAGSSQAPDRANLDVRYLHEQTLVILFCVLKHYCSEHQLDLRTLCHANLDLPTGGVESKVKRSRSLRVLQHFADVESESGTFQREKNPADKYEYKQLNWVFISRPRVVVSEANKHSLFLGADGTEDHCFSLLRDQVASRQRKEDVPARQEVEAHNSPYILEWE